MKRRRSNMLKNLVLVVDDNDDLREVIIDNILAAGFDTIGARNGQEALAIIKTRAVDVIVSDLNMPVVSGVQLLKTLRSLGYATPFIAMSGAGTRDEIIELLQLVAFDFVCKLDPFPVLEKAITEAASYYDDYKLQQLQSKSSEVESKDEADAGSGSLKIGLAKNRASKP
jgi:DNA-binding NtrC family response regulator